MPRAGKYSYPFYDIDYVAERLKRAYETIRDYQMRRGVVANALNMSEKGGGFLYFLAALEDYGLTENREGYIILTDLGKRLIADDEEAKSDAVKKIQLFKEINEAYGANPKPEQIEAWLRQKAVPDPLKAKELSSNVYKIYMSVSKYIRHAAEASLPGPSKEVHEPAAGVKQQVDYSQSPDVLKIEYGGVSIRIPRHDKESIRLAKAALEFIEKFETSEEKENEAPVA